MGILPISFIIKKLYFHNINSNNIIMKKSLFALIGLFTLVACSEDVYDEIDLQNEETANEANNGGMQTNSYHGPDHGYYNGGIIPGGGYVSPWDVWYRNNPNPPVYMIGKASGSLEMTVTAHVGLAYFDSSDDGFYNDPFLPLIGSPSLVADFWSGNYPNLFAGNQEIGNLIKAKPIIIGAGMGPENELPISSTDHLPVIQANVSPITNPNKLFFDISATATPQEIQLLADYGQVFYYEVVVTDGAGGNFKCIVEAANPTLEGTPMEAYWEPTYLQANVPGSASPKDIHYYFTNIGGTQWTSPPGGAPSGPPSSQVGYACDSREVVIRSTYKNKYPTALTPTSTVHLGIYQGSWLWQTSGLSLFLSN